MLPLGIRTPPAKTHRACSPTLSAGQLYHSDTDTSRLVLSARSRPTRRYANTTSLTAQHYGIRRRAGFPPKYLQRNSDIHMQSENVVTTSGIGVAQLAIYCSPAETTPLAIRSGRHIRARETGRPQAGSPPTAFAWFTRTAAALTTFGPTGQRSI